MSKISYKNPSLFSLRELVMTYGCSIPAIAREMLKSCKEIENEIRRDLFDITRLKDTDFDRYVFKMYLTDHMSCIAIAQRLKTREESVRRVLQSMDKEKNIAIQILETSSESESETVYEDSYTDSSDSEWLPSGSESETEYEDSDDDSYTDSSDTEWLPSDSDESDSNKASAPPSSTHTPFPEPETPPAIALVSALPPITDTSAPIPSPAVNNTNKKTAYIITNTIKIVIHDMVFPAFMINSTKHGGINDSDTPTTIHQMLIQEQATLEYLDEFLTAFAFNTGEEKITFRVPFIPEFTLTSSGLRKNKDFVFKMLTKYFINQPKLI